MTTYILNLTDLLLSLYALHHGGVELNLLMRCVPVMVAWKVVGVASYVSCCTISVTARKWLDRACISAP